MGRISKRLKSGPPLNRSGVIYTRVSSKEQEKEGFSIPAQQKILRDYAVAQGITVAQEFSDVETAKHAGRADFDRMISFLKTTPLVKFLLVEKTDRLYRNFRDYVTIDELDREIHLVKENEILSRDSRSHQKFIHGIKVLMAKNYVDNLSEETRKGMREKAEQGIYPSFAPVGYLNVKCGDKRFIQPDPAMVPLVQKIFEWYAEGDTSLRDLAQKVVSEGFAYRSAGRKLSKSMVQYILTNPIYHGDFLWRGTRYHGSHDPIVSRELFDKVQELLNRNGGALKRARQHTWTFQGLVKCGHCGCAMVAEKKKGKYVYYHCTGNRGKCAEPFVREEALDEAFAGSLEAIQLDEKVLEFLVAALRESHRDEKEYHDRMLASLQKRQAEIQERLDTIYLDRLDKKISEETYQRLREKLVTEQETVVRSMAMHQTANTNYLDSGVKLLELAQKAPGLYRKQSSAEKRRLLTIVHSNSTWREGRLIPEYRKPFDSLAVTNAAWLKEKAVSGIEDGISSIWLPGLDSNQQPFG